MPSKLERMRAQLLVWTRVVIFLLAASSSHAQTGDADSYTLRILPEANQIHVTAVLRPTSSRLFMDPTQADHLPNGWATFVRNLRVTSVGTPRTATPDDKGGWTIDAPAGSVLNLSYGVDLAFARERWPSGNEQAGAVFADGYYLVGRPLFVLTEREGARRVRIDAPAGWTISTPWLPTAADGTTFEAESAFELTRNCLLVGRHASVQVQRGPFNLELALPDAMRGAAPLVKPILDRTLAAYLRLFPSTPPTRFLMTFFKANAEDGESFMRSAAFTTSEPVTEDGRIIWGNFLAHELFHFWNGQRIRGQDPRTGWRWFAEGFTEYYANATLVRERLITPELFIKKVERHLGNYAYFMTTPALSRMSLTAAGTNTGTNRFGVYDGGWTIALCLDGLIREGSADERSLDDFMREAWSRFGPGRPGYTVVDLDRLAQDLAGPVAAGFLAAYVENPKLLPINECSGRFGLSAVIKGYAAEAFVFPDRAATERILDRQRRAFADLYP